MSKQEPFKWRKAKPAAPAPAPAPKAEPHCPARRARSPGAPQIPATPARGREGAGSRLGPGPRPHLGPLPAPAPSHEQIALRAYEIWEGRGGQHGSEPRALARSGAECERESR